MYPVKGSRTREHTRVLTAVQDAELGIRKSPDTHSRGTPTTVTASDLPMYRDKGG